MIRIDELADNLLRVVGWQKAFSTLDLAISDSLAESESGLYFQQAHPLLTLDNLVSLAPNFEADQTSMPYPVYGRTRQYRKGDVVQSGSGYYKALADSVGVDPSRSPETWMPTTRFSEWLEYKTKASIIKAVNRFCTEKLNGRTGRPLLENRTLFDGTARISDTIKNRADFVGFELVPVRAQDVTLKINRIGMHFTKPGDYRLYLFHSSRIDPVRVIEVHIESGSCYQWVNIPDLFLPYQGSNTDAGGSWFLGYFQSELPEGARAILKTRDWSQGPCQACSRTEYQAWLAWSRYLEVYPFRIDDNLVKDEAGVHLWDVADTDYDYNSNYGLNLDISVYCDLTDFITDKRHMFADIIMKQVAVDFLREFAYNPSVRANRHSLNAGRTDILYELDGDSSSLKKSGLNYLLDQAYAGLQIGLQGLNRVCFPCRNNGLKYRTI